jgi:hypothetical protein
MTRRPLGLLITFVLGLLVAPLAAPAQPAAKVPRFGFLIRGVGKEKRKISAHRLQTLDFLIQCCEAGSGLSLGLSWEILRIRIETSTASLYKCCFS